MCLPVLLQTQKYVRMYDLGKQQLVKKLMTGVKWISSIDVHPQGDIVCIGIVYGVCKRACMHVYGVVCVCVLV